MRSPRDSGRHEFSHQVVIYVDGGLSDPDLVAFEGALLESAELREEVARARAVRRLVSRLPRKQVGLPTFEDLLRRIDARPSPAIRAALDRLPRREAPADLLERIFEQLFRRELEPGRVLRPRVWRSLAASGLAAAALLFVALQLHGERTTTVSHPPKHGKLVGVRFEFSVVRHQPGAPRSAVRRGRTGEGGRR